MLDADEKILKILTKSDNKVLNQFKISFPDHTVAQESNSIFIACVDTENNTDGFDFTEFRDLVEILIVTKNRNYQESIAIIKTVAKIIMNELKANVEILRTKPIFRNITPDYNNDYVLSRGHMLIQVDTIEDDIEEDSEIERICRILNKGDYVIE